MGKKSILIVDDEQMVRQSVSAVFQREGMEVAAAGSGREALELLSDRRFDVIILDVMMDDMDGFYVVDILRKGGVYTPVLFLSGNTEEHSQILGISLGADDYLTKPFSITMLTTKVNALLRRSQSYSGEALQSLTCGPFRFDISTYSLFKRDKEIHLTSRETELVKYLMENPGRLLTKEQMYQHVWSGSAIDDNTIMVYVKRIRDKIEGNPKKPRYLKTVWGLGYQFDAE